MEPRARIGRNRGQQQFSDQECRSIELYPWPLLIWPLVQQFLFAHGDTAPSLDSTKRVLDELLTEFITELCFEAQRSAQLSGRQKIKIDDIKFACRKNPAYLGKMEDTNAKKNMIDQARKTLDVNDDKISKSNVKTLEEPLGAADDDMDFETKTLGGRSNGKGAGR